MSDKRYLRCYTKGHWLDPWVLDRQLSPERITLAAGSAGAGAADGAVLNRVWGKGVLEEGTPIVDGSWLTAYGDKYVKITRSGEPWGMRKRGEKELQGTGEELLFMGYIPAEQFNLLGESVGMNVKHIDHAIRAVGLERLLDRRMLWSYVSVGGGGGGYEEIKWLPTFNRKVRTGGVAGNMSADKITIDSMVTYIFDESASSLVWSLFDVLAYLLRYQGLYPPIKFDITDELIEALQGMVGVFDFSHHTLRQAISQIVQPARGMGWRIKIIPASTAGAVDLVRLHIYSLLPEAMTVGDVSLPAHADADRRTLKWWGDGELEKVTVTRDAGASYAHIVVRGGPIRTCCSFSYLDGTLEAGWTAADETAYKDAASTFDDDYATDDEDVKIDKNDSWRGSDRMGRVYTAFEVPKDWDWLAENYGDSTRKVNPLWYTEPGGFNYNNQGAAWMGQKVFGSFLPFRQGYDYDGAAPVNHNDAATKPELRKMFALVKRDGRWWYVDRMQPFSAHVAPLVDEMGARVRFRPNHLLGVNHFGDTGEEPSATDAIMGPNGEYWYELGADWEDLIVTAMVETNQRLQVEWGTEWSAESRSLVIEMPHAEIWHVAAGTIYGLNNVDPVDDGPFRRVALTEAGRLLRDDTALVKGVLAAAVAWYGRVRYKVAIESADLTVVPQIGMMLEGFAPVEPGISADEDGTCVSVVTIDFDAEGWRYTVRTDAAQLDFGAVAGMGTEDHPSTIRRQSRDLEVLKTRVQDLERQAATGTRAGGMLIGDTNPNIVSIIASTSIVIPAKSFVEIVSYDEDNKRFVVKQPSADNLPAKIVLVTGDEIAADTMGIAYIDGKMVVTRGPSVAEGIGVGTEKDEWRSKVSADGSYYCYGNTSSDALIRPAGSYGQFRMRFGVFEIVGITSAKYGVYSCRKQVIDETHWATETAGFVDDTGAPFHFNVEIKNIAEDGQAGHKLEIGDHMVAWREQGDEGGQNFLLGFSPKYAWWKG